MAVCTSMIDVHTAISPCSPRSVRARGVSTTGQLHGTYMVHTYPDPHTLYLIPTPRYACIYVCMSVCANRFCPTISVVDSAKRAAAAAASSSSRGAANDTVHDATVAKSRQQPQPLVRAGGGIRNAYTARRRAAYMGCSSKRRQTVDCRAGWVRTARRGVPWMEYTGRTVGRSVALDSQKMRE